MNLLQSWLRQWYWQYSQGIFLRFIIFPSLLGLGPAVLGIAQFMPKLASGLQAKPVLVGLLMIYPTVLYGLGRFVSHRIRPQVSIGEQELMILFELVDKIVEAKSKRFSEKASSAEGANEAQTGENIFLSITQPRQQIIEIVHGIYSFIYNLYNLKSIPSIKCKVALAKMGERHIEKFECFDPTDTRPRGEIHQYQNDHCGFTVAKQDGQLVIIPDIQAELRKPIGERKYCASAQASHDEQGSMIVYPIRHPYKNEIPYCISVFCSEPYFFKENNRTFFEYIMDKFAKRIRLEYSLDVLKSSVEDTNVEVGDG